MSLLTDMVAVGGRPRPGELIEGIGRARLCGYVKFGILTSVISHVLRFQRVEGRANAASSS